MVSHTKKIVLTAKGCANKQKILLGPGKIAISLLYLRRDCKIMNTN